MVFLVLELTSRKGSNSNGASHASETVFGLPPSTTRYVLCHSFILAFSDILFEKIIRDEHMIELKLGSWNK